MNKKRIAKERLYFLGCFAFGFFILPLLLFILFAKGYSDFGEFYSNFFKELSGRGDDFVLSLLVLLGPYFFFQLIRSIVWAWKTVRTR